MAVLDPRVVPRRLPRRAAVLTIPPEAIHPVVSRDRVAPSGAGLRRCLIMLDGVATAFAWSLALLWLKPPTTVAPGRLLPVAALAVPVALAAIAVQRLYLARVCSVRSIETERLIRAVLVVSVVAYATGRSRGVTVQDAAVGAGVMFVLLRAMRTAFAGYLHAARLKGHFTRPVVLVGGERGGVRPAPPARPARGARPGGRGLRIRQPFGVARRPLPRHRR